MSITSSPEGILSRLIQFDTVSHLSNLELLDWVEAYLAEYGVSARRIYDATGEKANMIATIGDATVPGYILSGHVDVVPVKGQDWSFDPFGGEIRDGRVLGRGASDMKGYLACVLAVVSEMVAAPLHTPLHLVFSHDEEIGCVGVRTAVADIAGWEVLPKGCFVGEPTAMQVVLGHKAKQTMAVQVRGSTAHSSLAPEAVNAVEYAARLTTLISDLGRDFQEFGARDPAYDVPHSTGHVGVQHGGRQVNIVPDSASLVFEFRCIGADDPAERAAQVEAFARDVLEPRMKAVHADSGFTFSLKSAIPGLDTDPASELISLTKVLAGRNDHSKVAFATEGGLFSEIGIPTVVIGPGNIDRAHKPDEFIEVAELQACTDFLLRLIQRCRV